MRRTPLFVITGRGCSPCGFADAECIQSMRTVFKVVKAYGKLLFAPFVCLRGVCSPCNSKWLRKTRNVDTACSVYAKYAGFGTFHLISVLSCISAFYRSCAFLFQGCSLTVGFTSRTKKKSNASQVRGSWHHLFVNPGKLIFFWLFSSSIKRIKCFIFFRKYFFCEIFASFLVSVRQLGI